MKSFLSICGVLCSVLCVCGCGGDGRPSLVPVTGKVTLNGEPIDGAMVGFQPQDIEGYNRPSTATTDAQGSFTVGTYGTDDGIPEGSYRVTVRKSEVIGKIPEGYNLENPEENPRPLRTRLIVPEMYADAEASGLTVTVTASGISPDVIALEGDPEVRSAGGRADDP